MAKRKRFAKIQKIETAEGRKIQRLKEQTSIIKNKKAASKAVKIKKLASKKTGGVPLNTGQFISLANPVVNVRAHKAEEAKRKEQEKLYAQQKAREIGRGKPPTEPAEFNAELGEDPIHQ